MNWTIDTLTLADARRVETLWRARWAHEGRAQADIDAAAQFASHRLVDFDEDRRRGRWILLGAAGPDTRLIGYLSAVIVPRLDQLMGFVFLDEIYVLPEARRQGVARGLLRVLLDTARRRGVTNVQLALGREAEALWRFFENEGFTLGITGWGVCRLKK